MHKMSLSKRIAEYCVEHGKCPYTRDGSQTGRHGHYQIETTIDAGRELKVYFWDWENNGIEKPHEMSRLEIKIIPSKENKRGYHTIETGLNGKFWQLIFFNDKKETRIFRDEKE